LYLIRHRNLLHTHSIRASSAASEIKRIGVGLAIAVVMDATLVRGLFDPATMRLLG
jgi:uncharacterized membrane protein YdfJ with MMPL/SSD domain